MTINQPNDSGTNVPRSSSYPARLEVAYPEHLSRLSTAFRPVLAIPIIVVVSVLTGGNSEQVRTQSGDWVTTSSASITAGLFAATLLLIVFRRRYPRWWFDFSLELTRFSTRIAAYVGLLTDRYPSTVDQQAVTLDVDYPDVEHDLNRWLPLVKWFLAIPHYLVLIPLILGAVVSVVIAWFAIVFTGRYPHALFDYVVGVARWCLRVQAYAFLLATDRYPPFTLR